MKGKEMLPQPKLFFLFINSIIQEVKASLRNTPRAKLMSEITYC